VAAELGDPALVAPPEREVAHSWMAVAGALVALGGTVAPWTRTGAGDRLFGAWVMDVRWSTVAAVAAVALLWLAWRSRHRTDGATALAAAVAGVVLVAAALAIVFPPTFQTASWGPWLTAAGAALAGTGALLAIRAGRGRTQGV
jgi:cytochrome bd-type quinol oxidase subunit 2